MDFFEKQSKKNGQEIGLSLLGSISAFSIWSAVNPSFYTLKAFAKPEQEKNIRFGMDIGVILDLALSAGLLLAYGKKGTIPALITAGTGGGLWLAYDHMVKQSLSEPDTGTSAQ